MQRIAWNEDKVSWPHMPRFVADHEFGFTIYDDDDLIVVRLCVEFTIVAGTSCDIRCNCLSITYEHAFDWIALRRRIRLKLSDDLMQIDEI